MSLSQDPIAVAQREAKVLALKTSGFTFAEIAEAVGFADQSGAYRAFRNALKKTVAQPANEWREIELVQQEQLWKVHYPKALRGDLQSFAACQKIKERVGKIMGYEAAVQIRLQVNDGWQREIEDLAEQLGVNDPTKQVLELEAAPVDTEVL